MADQEPKPVETSAVSVPNEAPEAQTEVSTTEVSTTEAVVEPTAAAPEDAMDVVEETVDRPAEEPSAEEKPTEEAPATEEPTEGSEVKETSEKPSTRNPPKNMLRVRRDLGITDDKTKKNRFDPMALGESSDPELIRTQVSTPHLVTIAAWSHADPLPPRFTSTSATATCLPTSSCLS